MKDVYKTNGIAPAEENEGKHSKPSNIINDVMNPQEKTQRICVYGIVQGVGFRPFVSRIADAAGVTGSVANKGSYVEIFLKGTEEARSRFLHNLKTIPPERSAILNIEMEDCSDQPFSEFSIIESEREAGDIFVSPDIATCPKCRQELYDKTNRRYMHPFINCTACGPRLTILDAMPYDRERTSMGEFPMCPECEWEYTHAETRRYDAQPVCCNDCGPEVYLVNRRERGREAIHYTRQAILDGKIVAIKGIGGFHLCCDATNEQAVLRLRELKHRPAKPFAIMMRNLDAVHRNCVLSKAQEEILDGHQKPILLLDKQPHTELAASVAPDNPKVGVMLPYAPVQMLLFDYDDDLTMTTDCFVMTSGNVSGAPICRTDEDAIKELSGFCDIILSHNRKIRLRADDSVMNFYHGEPYMIRRSRGYAPLPLMIHQKMFEGQVLAVGGELKNTFCIGKNQLLYPSPYVGDMADLRTVRALSESIIRMEELLEASPEVVVCDLHPKYNTTVVANEQKLPVIQIQHHYAHILSCMAENAYMEPVIGVSFDGTGYGTDGTIWGGEFLISSVDGFERIGSISPFLQIGGDASAKEGFRIAVSMLNRLFPEEASEMLEQLELCDAGMQKLYKTMGERHINCVQSTSAGRLFDAVSAILNIRKVSSFEGEASTTMQFRAEAFAKGKAEDRLHAILDDFWGSSEGLLQEIRAGRAVTDQETKIATATEHYAADAFLLSTDQLVKAITLAYLEEKTPEKAAQFAYVFHAMLAKMIAAGCQKAAEKTGIRTCALSGGVFQNQLLLELCEKALQQSGLTVLRHRMIPPNDGGLAVGQAVAGYAYLEKQRKNNLNNDSIHQS